MSKATSIDQPEVAKLDHRVTRERNSDGQTVIKKGHQVGEYKAKHMITTLIHNPPLNSNTFDNGTQFSVLLKEDDMKVLKSGMFRFKMTISTNSVELPPVPFWFERMEIYDRKSQVEIGRMYGENIYWSYALLNAQELKCWSDMVNFTPDKQSYTGKLSPQTRYFYLPLVASPLDNAGLDFSRLKTDIEFRFYPKQGIIADGLGSISVDEIAFVAGEKHPSPRSVNATKQLMAKNCDRHQYLSVQRHRELSRQMNANTMYSIDLDAFRHKSAYLLFTIRASDSNTNHAVMSNMDLCDSGIDIVSSSGQSLFGSGQSVKADLLKDLLSVKSYDNSFLKNNNVYSVIFSDDLEASNHGKLDGYHVFNGQKFRLELSIGDADVDDVQRISSSILPINGTIRIGFKNCYTPYLPYNTSQADWKEAIEDLQSVRDEKLQVTLSHTFDANVTVDITTINKSGQGVKVSELFVCDSQSYNAGTPNDVIVSRTQEGKCGWKDGQYSVNVYSYYYKSFDVCKNRIKNIRTL
jgi:hypothetical protein